MSEQLIVHLPPYSTDAVSEALRLLTQAWMERGAETSGGILGGEFGYGVLHDDATWMMHPYCWCEQDDCPWCAGCLIDRPDVVHQRDCYLWRVHDDLKAEGFAYWAGWPHDGPYGLTAPTTWTYEQGHAVEQRIWKKWCDHFGLSFPQGCAVHCTCGANAAYEAEAAKCTCDSCSATGKWATVGALPRKGAPNFWHKPSGVRVWWYKYIGRDMEIVSPGGVRPEKVVLECLPENLS